MSWPFPRFPWWDKNDWPAPKRCRGLSIETRGQRRKMDCRRYEPCLSIAAHARWPDFSCKRCRAYTQMPEAEMKDQDRASYDGAVKMLGKAFKEEIGNGQ